MSGNFSKSVELPMNFVPKGWGFEKWIVNCEEYCGKLLYFVKGKKCSWHYHEVKDEVFYIQSGKMLVKFSDEDDIELFEFSTQHFDSDSYRIQKGD